MVLLNLRKNDIDLLYLHYLQTFSFYPQIIPFINFSLLYFWNSNLPIILLLSEKDIKQFQSMSDIGSPQQQPGLKNKITTQKSSSVPRNFASSSYHSAFDLAKAYSGKVNNHMLYSNIQNHALKSACRTYNKELNKDSIVSSPNETTKIQRSKSSLITRAKSNSKPLKIENNKVVRNPEEQKTSKSVVMEESGFDADQKLRQKQLREVLQRKTLRVPEYSSQLEMACNYKSKLEQEIKNLRALINQEMKKKTKISLNCNKIMTERELTYKNYKTREEQNYHLNTAIGTTEKQNNFLQEQIRKLNEKNQNVKQSINNEEKECERLRKYVEKTRMVLMGEEKDVAKLKTMVTTSFNNMSNNYMNMNLLKSEKALLLADVDTQHSRNK